MTLLLIILVILLLCGGLGYGTYGGAGYGGNLNIVWILVVVLIIYLVFNHGGLHI